MTERNITTIESQWLGDISVQIPPPSIEGVKVLEAYFPNTRNFYIDDLTDEEIKTSRIKWHQLFYERDGETYTREAYADEMEGGSAFPYEVRIYTEDRSELDEFDEEVAS
jgi:hypothetical protein